MNVYISNELKSNNQNWRISIKRQIFVFKFRKLLDPKKKPRYDTNLFKLSNNEYMYVQI